MHGWLQAAGYDIGTTRWHAGDVAPGMDAIDLLIVMGGPMSVNDEAGHPWLRAEKHFIRQWVERGHPVLGVCLGAQLIAHALGARVYPNAQKEIGWYPVTSVLPASDHAFSFPEEQLVFHWHGETFDLPLGAIHLARSAACENQAFQFGTNAIGLQFHLETTPASAHDLVLHCRDELTESSPYVQCEEALLHVQSGRYDQINCLMGQVLGYLTNPRRRLQPTE